MSAEDRRKVELGAAVLVALLALISAVGTFFVLPYRMTAAENAIAKVQEARQSDHDILLRLDTRTDAMRQALERMEKHEKP